MKVALLTGDPGPGGREAAVELAPELARLGWDARLFWDDERRPPRSLAGPRTVHLKRSRAASRTLARAARQLQAALIAPRVAARMPRRKGAERLSRRSRWTQARIAAWRPRVLHVSAVIAAERPGLVRAAPCPVVLGFSGHEPSREGAGAWEPLWDRVAAVHAATPQFPDEVAVPPGIPVTISGPGVPAALRTDSGGPNPSGGRLRLLSAGPVTWEQGHEHALRAIAELRDGGLFPMHRIAGGGPHLDAVLFAREDLGLSEVVAAGDELDHEGLQGALALADAFIHPAIAPTASPAGEAALAAGVPVIASERSGMRGPGVTIVPSGDPAALAEAIRALAADPARFRTTPAEPRRGVADLAVDLSRLYRAALGMAA